MRASEGDLSILIFIREEFLCLKNSKTLPPRVMFLIWPLVLSSGCFWKNSYIPCQWYYYASGGIVIGENRFSNLFIAFGNGSFKTLEEAKEAGVPTLNYGLFINSVIDFLIISFSIFLVVRQVNRIRKKKRGACSCNNQKMHILFKPNTHWCYKMSSLYIIVIILSLLFFLPWRN